VSAYKTDINVTNSKFNYDNQSIVIPFDIENIMLIIRVQRYNKFYIIELFALKNLKNRISITTI